MPPNLRNTPISYRSCILYEFQLGRSIEEAYKNFCKNTKNHKIDYSQFEYWFNRFANESLASEFPSFSDLPFEIVGEIVEELDFKDRLNTRKVSRFLRSVVDRKKTEYGPKSILIEDYSVTIEFDDNLVVYNKSGDECLMKYKSSGASCNKQKVLNGDFLEIALNDLKIAMKNPKLRMDLLEFKCSEKSETLAEQVVKFLESPESPFQVKSLKFYWYYGLEYVFPILSKLKPGTLENINLGHMVSGLDMYKLIKMEQWKQAKEFCFTNSVKLGIKKFLHFNRFDIHVESSVSAKNILYLRNVISSSPNFEFCRLRWRADSSMIDKIGKVLGVPVVRRYGVELWKVPVVLHRHPIHGRNEFLDFEINPRELYIKRTN